MQERYAGYLRKSRADLELEKSCKEDILKRHKDILLRTAKSMGITINKWYEEVVSGETIASRPEVKELLRDVESGMWDGVFVVEVERLARGDTADQGRVASSFKLSKTKIDPPSPKTSPSLLASNGTGAKFGVSFLQLVANNLSKTNASLGQSSSAPPANIISICPYFMASYE